MTDQVSLAGLSRDADVQDVTPPDSVSPADNAWNPPAPDLVIASVGTIGSSWADTLDVAPLAVSTPSETRDAPEPHSTSEPVRSLSQSWDEHAPEWIRWVRALGRQDSYWRFHREKFLSLVPSHGQLIVDIGCGEGRVDRDLRRLGHRVLGIDSSFTMVHAAKTHPTSTTAVAADAAQLPLSDASVDCVVAFMSLQDMDNMPKAIEEAARILKDGQRFILAIVHPMYSVGNFSDAGPDAGNSFVINQSYFDKKRCARTDVHDDLIMTFHREHRPLQAYTQALTEAGFSIEQLHEVTEPNANEPRHGVPMFLDIIAVRQHRPQQTTSRHQPGSTVSGTGDHLRQHRRLGLQGRGKRSNPHPPGHPSPDQLQTAPKVLSADQQDRPGGNRFWLLLPALSALAAAAVEFKAHISSYHSH